MQLQSGFVVLLLYALQNKRSFNLLTETDEIVKLRRAPVAGQSNRRGVQAWFSSEYCNREGLDLIKLRTVLRLQFVTILYLHQF